MTSPPLDPLDFEVDLDHYRRADLSWLDELDDISVHAGPPHQRMATRGVALDDWLVVDELAQPELALRRRLWQEGRAQVFAQLPTAAPAAAEAATVVHGWLAEHHPASLTNWDEGIEEPLARAGLAIQDDLCLMEHDDEGGWRLTAALVCFPTYWRLADKIGHTQGVVHGPVPYYAADLEAKVERFFDRLRPGRIVGRRNWGFSASAYLYSPDINELGVANYDDPSALWLRSERQTLRRLPETGAILFTIRVQQAPAYALIDRPDLVGRLRRALEGWPPDLMDQRAGGRGWGPPVLEWLQSLDRT